MVPPVKEAQKLLQAFVKNVAESSRSFVRWMDGTCLEMPDQRPKGDTDGEQLVMQFSSEVLRLQQVRLCTVAGCNTMGLASVASAYCPAAS